MLERCGVLDSTKQGRTVLYRVRYQALIQSFRALANAIEICWLACGQNLTCDPNTPCCPSTPPAAARSPAPGDQQDH